MADIYTKNGVLVKSEVHETSYSLDRLKDEASMLNNDLKLTQSRLDVVNELIAKCRELGITE